VSGAAVIVGVTLRECLRRRVAIVVVVLTIAFLGLYAAATHLAFATVGGAQVGQAGTLVDAHALAGASLLGLAMFATLFLGAVLAVFLTFNVIRGDAEQGLLQPVVVRPIGRTVFVAARYAAACGICAAYVGVVYGAAVAITGLEGGWWPDSIVVPGLALAGGVCVVAAISLLGSVYLSTIANGIAVLMVYGAGLVSGLLGQIGYALPSPRLQEIGRDASWALPFDALYQAGLHALTADTSGFTGVIVHLGPLGGAQGAGPGLAVWAVAYVAVVLGATAIGLRRRDL
jgi:Cu-processing system permease protein